MLRFDWDEKKNRSNRKKHGVWFEEAQQVFDDAAALRFYDPDHSDQEDRFLLLGVCGVGRILVVVFCERDSESIIRIIPARKVTQKESKTYEKGI